MIEDTPVRPKEEEKKEMNAFAFGGGMRDSRPLDFSEMSEEMAGFEGLNLGGPPEDEGFKLDMNKLEGDLGIDFSEVSNPMSQVTNSGFKNSLEQSGGDM